MLFIGMVLVTGVLVCIGLSLFICIVVDMVYWYVSGVRCVVVDWYVAV